MDDNELQQIFSDGEYWPTHYDIRRYLMEERNEQDRWLTDFSKAWSGPKDSSGQLLSGRVPDDWAAEWYALNGKESNYPHKQNESFNAVIGDAISLNATESGVVLQYASNTIPVPPEDIDPLIAALTAAKKVVGAAKPTPQPPVAGQTSAFMHSQNYKAIFGDDRPGVKAARERNEQRMRFSTEVERKQAMDTAINRLAQIRRY